MLGQTRGVHTFAQFPISPAEPFDANGEKKDSIVKKTRRIGMSEPWLG